MILHMLEQGIQTAAGIAGLGTLALALSGLLRRAFVPRESENAQTSQFPRWTLWLLGIVIVSILAFWFWQPISIVLPLNLHWAMYIVGIPLYLAGLMLYLNAMRVLGAGYHPSGEFGVVVAEDDELITGGPYAYLRHPMYLAVIMAAFGGLLVFRTWAMVLFVISCVGLIFLAQREEQVLGQAFGELWHDYRSQVSAWFPRPPRRVKE
jgi:protein-S-isoprenylcysteine O-methyltransferase Ste14